MAVENSGNFYCSWLDDLDHGVIDLGVPIEDGAIIIGVDNQHAERSRIHVIAYEHAVSVVRSDGAPIQAMVPDYNAGRHFDAGETFLPDRIPVFAHPVDRLDLRKQKAEDGRPFWFTVGESANVTSIENIQKLASTIGMYALGKQQRTARV